MAAPCSDPDAPTGAVPPFRDLLRKHMREGTRPDGRPGKLGTAWSERELAEAVHHNERTVRYWCTGRHLPNNLRALERAWFGDSELYDHERRQLRRSLEAAKDITRQIRQSELVRLGRAPKNYAVSGMGSEGRGE